MSTSRGSATKSKSWGTAEEQAQAPNDLAYGQIVIVAFRWILVIAGLVFTMWNPGSLSQLRVAILLILSLAGVNFYLHSQLMRRKTTVETVAYAASAGDIAVISLIALAQGGFESPTYIFYYPAILVFSVAFPSRVTYAYTIGTMVLYALITSATTSLAGPTQQVLITRLLTLAGTGVCGNLYWRVERDRRRAAAEARDELLARIREHERGGKQ